MEGITCEDGANQEQSPYFERQEIWIMNTEFQLYDDHGPTVSLQATHKSRLDEMAKCITVVPGFAAVRVFWADAVLSVEGPDLAKLMRFLGKRAPTEQQISKFLWPNINAAWHGQNWTRSLQQAIDRWTGHEEYWQELLAVCRGIIH